MEELIRKTLEDLNHQLPRVAQVKYFRILPEALDIDEDEVTPTMKVKRRIIEKRYRDMIDSMY